MRTVMLSDLPCKSPYSLCVKRLTQASINQTAITVKCLLYHSAEYKHKYFLRKIRKNIGQVLLSLSMTSSSVILVVIPVFLPTWRFGPTSWFCHDDLIHSKHSDCSISGQFNSPVFSQISI